MLLCASRDRSGRSAWPEVAPRVDSRLDTAKICSNRRVDADRPRLRAVLGEGKTFLHSLDLFRWGLPYCLLQQQNAHLKDGSAHADQAAQFPSPACVRDAPIRAIPGKPFRAWRAGRVGGAMSAFDGTFRTRIDVRLESVMRFKADIGGQPTDQFNEEISAPH